MDTRRYKKALLKDRAYFVPEFHSMCIAGYLDCPIGPTDHYHCANCGGISGHQGHYSKLPLQTEWQFNCPEENPEMEVGRIEFAPLSVGTQRILRSSDIPLQTAFNQLVASVRELQQAVTELQDKVKGLQNERHV